jgi:hypothetical protein
VSLLRRGEHAGELVGGVRLIPFFHFWHLFVGRHFPMIVVKFIYGLGRCRCGVFPEPPELIPGSFLSVIHPLWVMTHPRVAGKTSTTMNESKAGEITGPPRWRLGAGSLGLCHHARGSCTRTNLELHGRVQFEVRLTTQAAGIPPWPGDALFQSSRLASGEGWSSAPGRL